MSAPRNPDLPVAVIGGGPVGLAAAAHLVTRGVPVRLYEAGETVAAHVRDWSHVRLFSPWRFNTDAAATAILRERGWQAPAPDALPTGHDLYAAYLEPLAATPALQGVIETGARVRNVSRHGIDKVVSHARGGASVRARNRHGRRAVPHRSCARRHRCIRYMVQSESGVGLRHAGDRRGRGCGPYRLWDSRRARARPRRVCGPARAGRRRRAFGRQRAARPRTPRRNGQRGCKSAGRSAARISRAYSAAARRTSLPARGKLGDDLKRLVDSGRLTLVIELRGRSSRARTATACSCRNARRSRACSVPSIASSSAPASVRTCR